MRTLTSLKRCRSSRGLLGVACIVAIAAWLSITCHQLFAQGGLVPTGSPAPTMKRLDQIEPRIDVQTLPGDASNQFVISAPGSYYLTANINGVPGKNGISIQAENVSLDLNGFALISTQSSSLNGVIITEVQRSIVITNGTVRGWGNHGVARAVSAISGDAVTACIFQRLSLTGNHASGLVTGNGCNVRDCVADGNGADGFLLGAGCVVEACAATGNHSSGFRTLTQLPGSSISSGPATFRACLAFGNAFGFDVGFSTITGCSAVENEGTGITMRSACTITDSSATDNGGDGISADIDSTLINCTGARNRGSRGISAQGRATLIHCTAAENRTFANVSFGIEVGPSSTVIGCSSSGNINFNTNHDNSTGAGIYAGSDSTVKECTAQGNSGGGIQVGDRCIVSGCNASGNGVGAGAGTGIAAGIRALITGCVAKGNSRDGISVAGESVVTGNTASANGTGATAAGIRVTGSGSRIEGNHARDNNGTGVLAGGGDIIIRNSAGNNSVTSYNPFSGANFGPIQSPATATSPVANIIF